MKMSLAEVRDKRMRWSKLKKFKEFKEYIDAWKYFFSLSPGIFLGSDARRISTDCFWALHSVIDKHTEKYWLILEVLPLLLSWM